MSIRSAFWLFLPLLAFCLAGNAQSVAGKWYGIGRVQMEDAADNYMTEMILKQDGKLVKGEFNYYFKDRQKTNKIEGSFDKNTRILTIKGLPVIFYKTNDTRKSVESIMWGRFELRVSKTASVLNGLLTSNTEHQYMVPDIKFRFLRSISEPIDTVKTEDEPDLLALDRKVIGKDIENPITNSMPTKALLATSTTFNKNLTEQVLPIKDTIPIIETRQKNYIREIELDNDHIGVEIYDNGTIDYDSVSLYLNGKQVLAKTMLSHRSVKLNLQLDPNREFNELSMFAENLGMIPPNTAALIVHDGQKEYQLLLQSDFSKSATLKLKVKKPNP